MKKFILVVLIAVTFVLPVFAEKGFIINPKVGIDIISDWERDWELMLELNLLYKTNNNILFGIGSNYFFDNPTKLKSNIYLELEKEYIINSKNFKNLYPILRQGIALPKFNNKDKGKIQGYYTGLGIGITTKHSFSVELLFSLIYNSYNDVKDHNNSTLTLNIGYKFIL